MHFIHRLGLTLLMLCSTASALEIVDHPAASDPTVARALAVIEPGTAGAKLIFRSSGDSFVPLRIEHHDNGSAYVRLQRNHFGLRVWLDTVQMDLSATGEPIFIECSIESPIDLTDVKPRATAAQARAFALGHFKHRVKMPPSDPELLIYSTREHPEAQLAWDVKIIGTTLDGVPGVFHSFISADATSVLGTQDEVKTIDSFHDDDINSGNEHQLPREPRDDGA